MNSAERIFWATFLAKFIPPVAGALLGLLEDIVRWHLPPMIARWKVRRMLRRELQRRIREARKAPPDPEFATLHQYSTARRLWHAATPIAVCAIAAWIAWQATLPAEHGPACAAAVVLTGLWVAWRRWSVTHALIVAAVPEPPASLWSAST